MTPERPSASLTRVSATIGVGSVERDAGCIIHTMLHVQCLLAFSELLVCVRRARGRSTAVVGLLVLASAIGFVGCSRGSPSLPTAPVEVVDLVGQFSAAIVADDGGHGEGSAPHVKTERSVLHVPFGWKVTYELEVPADAALVSLETKVLGAAVGRLEVVWIPRGGQSRILTRDLSAEPDREARFGNHRREVGSLSLAAFTAVENPDPRSGVRVIDPVVMAGLPIAEQAPAVAPKPTKTPNIIVYLIDALRADRLGCYGYGRATSPEIDAFAATGLRFSRAQAQTSWTRPAVASVLTGLLPQQHRAIDKSDVLPEDAVTLPELLADAGFQTAAVISNGNVARVYGFSQGFSYFKHLEQVSIGSDVVRSDDVNRAVFEWLDEERREGPFFLYVHTVDPHLPYDPPAEYRRRFASDVDNPDLGSVTMVNELAAHADRVTPQLIKQLSDLYDAEVAANDASFGELLDGLEERALDDDTIVVLLSDHGEEFFDHHGWTHGNTLFAEMLDVPLIIRIPGTEPRTVPEIVQHVDLFATLLELAHLDPPEGVFGRSAVRLWTGAPGEPWLDRCVSHLDIRGRFAIAWTDPHWKLHVRRLLDNSMKTTLYDRVADPTEQQDVAADHPDRVTELRARYRDALERAGVTLTDAEVDAEHESQVEAQLKALGYL